MLWLSETGGNEGISMKKIFVLLLALWILVGVCALLFGAIAPRAGRLMLPYLAWLTFAAYLNLGVWLLNR